MHQANVAKDGGYTAEKLRTVCRLKVGDTAGWKTCATSVASPRRRAGFLRLPMAVPALQSGVKTILYGEPD